MLTKKLASHKNIMTAFEKALNERYFFGHAMYSSEIHYAIANRDDILDLVQHQLKSITNYTQEFAFYYSMPKSELVDRPVAFLPFKELVIRYAFINIIAEAIDIQLIPTCFANRYSTKPARLTEHFANVAWPNYCHWQMTKTDEFDNLISTDIAGFYDSIRHDKLIAIIAKRMGISESNAFLVFFKRILSQRIMLDDGSEKYIEINSGLIAGPVCEGILANIYLAELDDKLAEIKDIEYGRYVDDIKIYSHKPQVLKFAFKALQTELQALNLVVNTAKTHLLSQPEQLFNLMKKEIIASDGYNFDFYEGQSFHDLLKPEEFIPEKTHDKRLPDFDRTNLVRDIHEAKEFCFALNEAETEWTDIDIANLIKIFKKYPSSSKHAAWLIVNPLLFHDAFDDEITQKAYRFIFFELLASQEIHYFVKCRVLHHLTKTRLSKHNPCILQIVFDNFPISKVVDKLIECIRTNSKNTLLVIYCLEALKIIDTDSTINDINNWMKKANIKPNHFIVNALEHIYSQTDKK